MKKFFRKQWFKIFVRLNRTIRPVVEIDENEKTAASICRKLINDQNSKFLIAPLSQKRYIRNESLQMFVILQEDRINITNHIYNYDLTVSSQLTQRLNRMFDNKVEEARLKFEKEIHSQVRHSLKKILEKLT
jgi:hypothetical protein